MSLIFKPLRIGGVEDPRALRPRLEHIEQHLSLLSSSLRVQVDESGAFAGLAVDGADELGGSPGGGGGGGGGPADPSAVHTLLDGYRHEDTADAAPVGGDLVYANAAEWDRLPIGTEGQVLKVVSGAPEWSGLGTTVSASAPLGSFAKGNISGLTGTDSVLKNCWTKATTDEIPQVMPAAGSVLYLSAALDGDIGGVGDDVTLTLYKNGVATALTLVLAGGAGTEQYFYPGTGGPITFAAGDQLAVYGKKAGSPGARELTVTIWGRLES